MDSSAGPSIIVLVFLLAAQLLVPANCLFCRSCDSVQSDDDCTTAHVCKPGEICFHDVLINDTGSAFTRLGCRNAMACRSSPTIVGKRANHNLLCSACCNKDVCKTTSCQNVAYCLLNPCVFGTCNNLVNDYTCTCIHGYSGKNCDTVVKIDACLSNPCLNGKCTSTSTSPGYTCTCNQGYTGTNCEKDCSGYPVDILFLLDASTSVWFDNFNTMKQFVVNLTLRLAVRPGTVRIGVTTFSSYVHNEFDIGAFVRKPQELVNAINKIDFMTGGTRTDLALEFARSHSFTPAHGDRPNVPNILILLTDGQSNNPNLTTTAAQDLHGIQVIAVGISKLVDVQELHRVASTDKDVFLTPFDTLYTVADRVRESVCRISVGAVDPCAATRQCMHGTCSITSAGKATCVCDPGYNGAFCDTDIDECSSSPCQHGTCMDKVNDYLCMCTSGYSGKNCDQAISHPCSPNPCIHGTCATHSTSGFTCTCNNGYTGDLCDTIRSPGCKDVPTYHLLIHTNGIPCDMTTDGGGWTVIMSRQSDAVNFTRTHMDYTLGFGSSQSDFWIGLDYMHMLTSDGHRYQLRIELTRGDGSTYYEVYDDFSVGPRPDFVLHIGASHGTAGDALRQHDGYGFTTFDHDVDSNKYDNCAQYLQGGWWFHECYDSCLTCPYEIPGALNKCRSMSWNTVNYCEALKTAKLLVRQM